MNSPWRALPARRTTRTGRPAPDRLTLTTYPATSEAHIDRFADHYNHRRYHESLQNLTPADVYFGRGQTILLQREKGPTRRYQTQTSAPPAQSSLV